MENKIEIIETIGKIAVFVMVLLSIFLFTVKTKNHLSNRLLGIYLMVIVFDLIGLFTNKTLEYPIIHNLKMASSLLQLPLFYLYVLSACYSNFKIRKKHVVHFILFFVFFILLHITTRSNESLLLYEIVGELQFILYIVLVFLVLKNYKTIYRENYSNTNYELYKWLFQITVFSCIAHAFVLLRWYASNSKFQEYVLNINILISLSVLGITIFFVLKALYQPDLFKGINSNLNPINSFLDKKTSINNTRNNDIKSKYIPKLTSYMVEEKPYLDYQLTLQKLADQIQIPEKELSLLINHYLNKHFFDFINEYRINDAKTLLKDVTKKEVTVLEIVYQVGFNSKSSFYTAFKKVTGQTPTAYRKSVS
ncbi:MAG: AraC family transcriptional regulator [Winogradskyella sp.]|uniref:helix-turn-helix domain-containing protein n=1 Tax=Winogradskyella sp. TaxID=1883156 RepID=UPI0025DBBB8D|nr:helix-turn-helix domain-containing protein [Winogradskyella sp.]NRB82601.1 AraC family transcriptional regulator [Winogradskyella sp.]